MHTFQPKGPVIHMLAPRERQVVQCVAEGYTNREIALLLGISAHTVRNTLATVFIKTGASSRVVLTRLYLTGTLDGAAE
jgi:DNA-binding CsgD family transcriptional regulator